MKGVQGLSPCPPEARYCAGAGGGTGAYVGIGRTGSAGGGGLIAVQIGSPRPSRGISPTVPMRGGGT